MKIVGLAYVAFLLLSLAGALAGPAWLIAVVPGVPTWSTLAVVLFGVVAELALAMWLLIAPER